MSSMHTELYDTLGVTPSATEAEIKRAFRKKAINCHPDKGGDPEEFKKINKAHEILSNPEKRKLYDEGGLDNLENRPGMGGMRPEDILSHIFGGLFSGPPQGPQPYVEKCVVTLEDLCQRKQIQKTVTVDITCSCYSEEKCTTCAKCKGKGNVFRSFGNMAIHTICDTCRGKGKDVPSCAKCQNGLVKKKVSITLKLTPDMYREEGYQYCIPKKGHQKVGEERGDIYFIILCKPHDFYTCRDGDLIVTLNVPLVDSLCGFIQKIKHPSGEDMEVKVDNVVDPDYVLKISSKGLDANHDLHLRFNIIFPKKLTEIQKNKIREIL